VEIQHTPQTAGNNYIYFSAWHAINSDTIPHTHIFTLKFIRILGLSYHIKLKVGLWADGGSAVISLHAATNQATN